MTKWNNHISSIWCWIQEINTVFQTPTGKSFKNKFPCCKIILPIVSGTGYYERILYITTHIFCYILSAICITHCSSVFNSFKKCLLFVPQMLLLLLLSEAEDVYIILHLLLKLLISFRKFTEQLLLFFQNFKFKLI